MEKKVGETIAVVTTLEERSTEHDQGKYTCFTDYEMAFDRLELKK